MFALCKSPGRLVYFFAYLILGVLIGTGITPSAQVKAAQGSPFVSEIAYGGTVAGDNCRGLSQSFTCSQEKWLEIYNPTQSSLDLSGYSLQIGTNYSTRRLSGVIAPLSGFVIADSGGLGGQKVLTRADLRIGMLNILSNNTAQNRYVKLRLLQSDQIIQSIDIDNLQLSSLEKSIGSNQSAKFTLNFESQASAPFIDTGSSYGRTTQGFTNYGSPGRLVSMSGTSNNFSNDRVSVPAAPAANPASGPAPQPQTTTTLRSVQLPVPNQQVVTLTKSATTKYVDSQPVVSNSELIRDLAIDTLKERPLTNPPLSNLQVRLQNLQFDTNSSNALQTTNQLLPTGAWNATTQKAQGFISLYLNILILTLAFGYFLYKNLESIGHNYSKNSLTNLVLRFTTKNI